MKTYPDRPDITPARVNRLADRLCWLSQGQDGMRVRHGLQRSLGKAYRDEFDVLAEQMAPEWLPVKEQPTLLLLPTLQQPTLPGF